MASGDNEFGNGAKYALWGLVGFVLSSPFYLSDMSSKNHPLDEIPVFQDGASAKASQPPLRIASWNFEKGTLERIDALGPAHFGKAASAIDADILLVQEMGSAAAAAKLAAHLGFDKADVAVSDFNRDDGEWFQRLELAVISRVPIKSVREYDLTPDKYGPVLIKADGRMLKPAGGEHRAEIPVGLVGEPEDFPDDRGILRVELENGLVLYNLHLTSNYPEYCVELSKLTRDAGELEQLRDEKRISPLQALRLPYLLSVRQFKAHLGGPANAQARGHWYKVARKREQIAAALAKLVAADVAAGKTVLAAGDFNTTAEEPCRSGARLDEDAQLQIGCNTFTVPDSCGDTDGFDDTLALLTEGLVDGLRMRPLSYGIGRTQHGRDEKKFPDAPIDHMFVAGPEAEKFAKTEKIDDGASDRKVFASDHNPLVTLYRR